MEMIGTHRRTFRNIVGHAQGVTDVNSLMSWTAEQFDPALDWDKIKRIMDLWGGKVILKGILDPEDARRAADLGADAIVRVEPRRPAARRGAFRRSGCCRQIVRAVGDDVENPPRQRHPLRPGRAQGHRHGRESPPGIGRAYVHGLGAMGQQGVTRALEVIHKELDFSMALCGHRDLAENRARDPLHPARLRGRFLQLIRRGGHVRPPAARPPAPGRARPLHPPPSACDTAAPESIHGPIPPVPRRAAVSDAELFELRWQRGLRDLTDALSRLYPDAMAGGLPDRLRTLLETHRAERPADLRRLDLERDLDPDWFLSEKGWSATSSTSTASQGG